MAFNGSGLFTRLHNWVADKNNAINITSSEVDAEDDGFAAGLTLCVTRDGQGKMAADFLPNADAAYNAGAVGARWKNLVLSGTITANGGKDVTPNSGSWTTNLSGPYAILGPSITLKWERVGSQVTIWCDAQASGGASSSNPITISAMPAEIVPSSARAVMCASLISNGNTFQMGCAYVQTNNTIIVQLAQTAGAGSGSDISLIGNFPGSSTCGIMAGWSVTYSL